MMSVVQLITLHYINGMATPYVTLHFGFVKTSVAMVCIFLH